MKHIQAKKRRGEFDLLAVTKSAQSAMMTLKPGASSDDMVRNEHPKCEQWLFVVSGMGSATVQPRGGTARSVKLRTESLLVIERGEPHRIKNTGSEVFRAFTFYVPPAYDSRAEPRTSAKRKKPAR